ncbi:hypothetical protein [Nonomuraea salmonea]|uniref:hypothetical protein n=1 Tax=Nonomuraea salmonea TaxID=46181 RepID=UPI002FE71721
MREHAGVSREELKHSAAVTVAVLLAVGLIAAWNVLIPGVDAWENIVAAVIGSLRLTGPVAAAFAAWVALRKRRALRGRSLTTWRALKAPLAIVVVVLGSFGATVLVLAVKTVLTDQAGRLSLSGLGMGMAGLALYSVIGWVAGWVVPKPYTPPIAGLACYGVFSWLADDRGWADKLAPGTGEPYDLFQGLSGAPFFDQTIWLLGLTAALLLGWAALVTRQAMVLACALLAVLAAGMGVSRVLTQAKPAAAVDIAYSCQEWPITVCVHPGMRAGLTELGGGVHADRLAARGHARRVHAGGAAPAGRRAQAGQRAGPRARARPVGGVRRGGGVRVRRVARAPLPHHGRRGLPPDRHGLAARRAAAGHPAARAPVRDPVVLLAERAAAPRVAAHVLHRLPGLPAVEHPLRRRPRAGGHDPVGAPDP